ncbi:MAG TPA: glycerol acyltransferase, partial [Chitinophagaceae bacterium]|nr:glycerol acyltransferase [Chitinophagaceae bacterium]
MQMNYMSPAMSAHQKIINQRLKVSLNSLFCVSEGKNLNEALQQADQSEKQLETALRKNEISAYQGIASFLLSDDKIQERQNHWKSYWTPLKKARLQSQLQRIGTETGFNKTAFDGIVRLLNEAPKSPDSIYHNTFKNLFAGLVLEDSNGVRVISVVKASQVQRTNFIEHFTSSSHQYVTDRQMITSRFVTLIRDDFYNILFYTSFIVFFTILISYGRIEIALISFIPMVLTWICILGLMGLLGIEFNIINIIISTLIFGLGDDYSIFITDGLLEKYKYGKPKLSSIRVSIYLSAMTTIIGLGVLIFAKHPALQSIALVSVIGILSMLLISQNIQPLLFNYFIQKRANKKFHPFTLWSFT